MARKCCDDPIWREVENNAALMGLPPLVRFAWMMLARVMMRSGVSVLRFGSAVASMSEIAMMVTIPQTQLEPSLEPLFARGLLVREADGAIGVPLLAKLAARAETSRINGMKGGRPPKRREPDGQPEMLYPMPSGGAAAVAETQAKPGAESSVSSPKLAAAFLESVDQQASCLTRDARVEAGIGGDAKPDEVQLVRRWLKAGLHEDTILRVCGHGAGRGVRTLFYFQKAMNEEMGLAEDGSEPSCPFQLRRFNDAYDFWTKSGERGPEPKFADFGRKAA